MRYAIYFTPPADDPLTELAAHWLGRDAFTGEHLPQTSVTGMAEEWVREATADPRRYGFHATLKAPFRIAEGQTEAALLNGFDAFCAPRLAFDIPKIVLRQIDGFFALVPEAPCYELNALADDAVRHFDGYRAPLSEADIARRRPDGLSASERDNLLTWGYPHVFEDFRFHMTLTGRISEEQTPAMRAVLAERFAAVVDSPLAVAGLGLFVEPAANADFTVKVFRSFPER